MEHRRHSTRVPREWEKYTRVVGSLLPPCGDTPCGDIKLTIDIGTFWAYIMYI